MRASETALLQNALLIAATILVIAIGLAVIHYVRRLMREPEVSTEEDQLAEFQAAYEAGEMDSNEFRLVCESLQRRSERERTGKLTPPPRLRDRGITPIEGAPTAPKGPAGQEPTNPA
ncbi:MAG: hypothetical protein IRY99_10135 [Isosphaeraceae bacterium]|nr:hypothetical protein [Isosphaeraceae bacterium]